jgi:lipopolysaccharide transport system ATP-binding protein
MSNIAIRVENLGKQYFIGQGKTARYETLSDRIVDIATSPFRSIRSVLQGQSSAVATDNIWALKNASFEVKHGEVIGIIGRNGAGKSTLLKVLSQITEPTEGVIDIYGRVGALLEVGTGFHPELTGRENVYLNGAILGMKRAEIKRKFDEIVDFSGIEKFIDTPVKYYSSGMQVRLAFAVAAHLEPEILIVDEVLAVGDAEFQKKCLGKMGDVTKEGRTVLFVSHNMVAVQSLCQRSLLLNNGQIIEDGPTDQVVSQYLGSAMSVKTEQTWDDPAVAPGNEAVRLHKLCVRPEHESPDDMITMEKAFVIEIAFWNLIPDTHLNIAMPVFNEQGIFAFGTNSIHEPTWSGQPFPAGLFHFSCHIPGNLLNSGTYHIHLRFVKDQNEIIFRHDEALFFEVVDTSSNRGAWYGRQRGVFRPLLKWDIEHSAAHVVDIP